MFDRPLQLMNRLGTYPWWQVLIEFGIIWVVVYVVVRFVQGTRAAGAIKGMLFVLVTATLLVRILGRQEAFQRITFLYENFLTLLAIALVVVFQPELRRGLIRLGETPLFRRSAPGSLERVMGSIADATRYLSKAKFGGLIVIERETPLKGLVAGGTPIGSEVSSELLQTIFFPGSALHDLAVVISGDRIRAAAVQLPLAEPEEMPDASLGSRHRAAVGLTRECDALAVVVSEETGSISLAERGKLDRGMTPEQLRDELIARMRRGGLDVQAEVAALGHEIGRIKRAVSGQADGGNGREDTMGGTVRAAKLKDGAASGGGH